MKLFFKNFFKKVIYIAMLPTNNVNNNNLDKLMLHF